jgi:hypothetical protein
MANYEQDNGLTFEYRIVDGPMSGRVYYSEKAARSALTLGRRGWRARYRDDNRYPDARIQIRAVVREGWADL